MEVIRAVEESGDSHLQAKFSEALTAVEKALQEYGLENVALSFNGGKDCTVILHIVRAGIWRTMRASHIHCNGARDNEPSADCHSENGFSEPSLTTIYFKSSDVFPEIHEFTMACVQRYKLQVEVLQGDYSTGLEELLKRRPLKAIFLGTRADDPNARGQGVFAPSSPGWPQFMRVNPILHWSYRDVWTFLLAAKVPYCSLYDRGYTSIGNIYNTLPNEALRIPDGEALAPGKDSANGLLSAEGVNYRPAYMLQDGQLERAGRVSKQKMGNPESEDATKPSVTSHNGSSTSPIIVS